MPQIKIDGARKSRHISYRGGYRGVVGRGKRHGREG